MSNELVFKLRVDGAEKAANDIKIVAVQSDVMSSALSRAGSSAAGLLGFGIGLPAIATGFVKAADAATILNNQLKLATGSSKAAAEAYAELYQIAQRSRTSFTELGSTYAAIARAGGELGVSQTRLLKVTEAIGNALAISGGSAEGARAALTQLGQGLASGTLRGEELNSVMEQTPRLAKAIADGLNIPIGKLRELGAAGELTAEQVLSALEKSAAQLTQEVEGSVVTVGQAFTQLQNAALGATGRIDEATGASSGLATEVQGIAKALETLSQNATVLSVLQVSAQTAALLWSDLKFVVNGVGTEIGGIAAQLAQLAQGNFKAAGAIRGAMQEEAASARRQLDERQRAIVAPRTAATFAADESAGDERLVRQSREAVAVTRQRAEAESKLADIRQRLSGVSKTAATDAKALDQAEKAGLITSGEKVKLLGDLARKSAGGGRGGESGFADLRREIQQTTESIEARMAAGGQLTKAQELELRLNQQLADKADKLTKAQREQIKTDIAQAVAKQEKADAQELELKAATKAVAERAALRSAEEKSIDDFLSKEQEAREKAVSSVKDRVTALRDEEAAVAKARDLSISLAEAVELVAIARTEEAQSRLQPDSAAFADLQREIDARKELLGLLGTKAAREANDKAAKEALDTWQRTVDQIGQSLTDALMQGGKSAWEYIKGLFRSTVLRPIIQAVVAPITGGLSSAVQAFTGGGGGQGGFGDLSKLFGGGSGGGGLDLSSLYSKLSEGLSGSISNGFAQFSASGFGQSLGLSQPIADLTGVVSNIPTSLSNSLGSILGAGGNAFAAYGISKTLSGGYSVTGGNALNNIAAAASFIPGVGPIAGIVTGAINRLFGRKLADQGIEGTLGGTAGFEGSSTQFLKGGFLRSDKTVKTALDAEFTNPLAASVTAIKKTVADYAGALNLPVDQIAGFTQAIKFSTKDLSPEQVQAKLQEALAGFGDALAGTFADQVAPFQTTGEKAGETLARLASAITGVNPLLEQLGLQVFSVGLAGADAASQLAAQLGGLEGLSQASSAYFQAYYSDAERAAKATESITGVLGKVGLSLPATRDEFRKLVEAQDLTTESGRNSFAALLKVSGAFAEITTGADDAAKAVAETAKALREQLTGAIDSNVGKFLSPEQQTARQYSQIASSLQTAGVDVSIEQLLGATKAQIFDFAQAFVAAADNSDAAKLAVVNAAGSLADLKDAAAATAKELADRAAELAGELQQAINGNVDKFLSPEQRRQRQVAGIGDNLAAVGVNIPLDKLLGASKVDIFEFAKSFVATSTNSTEAKIAVVNAAGALADLADTATQAARDVAAADIERQMKAITDTFGDLSVIEQPLKTVSQLFVENRDALKGLETGLSSLLGTTAKTIQETLADLLNSQKALRSYREGLASTIEETRLRTLSPADRVASLRSTEAQLFGQLQTAADPVAVAQRLQGVILQRIKEEAGIRQAALNDTTSQLFIQAELAKKARDAQISSLQQQINGFERLRDLAGELGQFQSTLKFGELSPLDPAAQLAEAQRLFAATAEAAKAGDANAVGNVTGNASALLQEARSFFGSSAAFAEIFAQVQGTLSSVGAAGAAVDPQIAALQGQLDQLAALNAAQDKLRSTIEDTSAADLVALQAVEAAVVQREAADQVRIDETKVLAQQQIDALREVVDGQAAQLTQAAEGYRLLEQQLQALNDKTDALLNNTSASLNAPPVPARS